MRRIPAAVVLAVLAAGLFATSSSLGVVPVAGGVGAAGTAPAPHTSVLALAAPSTAIPAPPPAAPPPVPPPTTIPSTGRGTFFENHPIPSVPTANQPCFPSYYFASGVCVNNTDEPSLNLTSDGVLALAYTAYTGVSLCPGFTNTSSEIGFTTSSDLGATWAAPSYLGTTACTGTNATYQDAAQPTITSLANGTLVLAYEVFNYTYCSGCYYPYFPPYFDCGYMVSDKIVAQDSFDDGVTWTSPVTISSLTSDGGSCPKTGYPELQPRAAAIGDTVYVTWANYTQPFICSPSAAVHLRDSTDGGRTWGTAHTVRSLGANGGGCGSTVHAMGMNPDLLVEPRSGAVDIAYDAAMTDQYNSTIGYYLTNVTVEFARSTDNGSTFAYAPVTTNAYTVERCCYYTKFMDPMPALAYDPARGQVYAAWASGIWGTWCPNYGYYTYCGDRTTADGITVANSSTNGTKWSVHPLHSVLQNPNNGSYNQLENPSIAVTPDGVLHLQVTLENDSACLIGSSSSSSTYCGGIQQYYLNSSTEGATFGPPINVSPNWTVPYYYYEQEPTWSGEYSSLLTVGASVVLAWTSLGCPTVGGCYGYYTPGTAQVTVSKPYAGTGVTLTFTETGLPTGLNWTIEVMGNERRGPAPTALVVTGVPPAGQVVAFSFAAIEPAWGVEWTGTATTSSPASFAKNATIAVTFTEQVLFTVATIPIFSSYCWSTSGYCSNYAVTPTPGATWIAPGATQSLSVSPVTWASYVYGGANMSFLSWTGSGPGNVSSTSSSISVTPTGPVNETANFNVNGYCWYYSYYTPPLTCFNVTGFPLSFVETGLPAKVKWSVSIVYPNGTVVTNTTAKYSSIGFVIPATAIDFYVWTTPDPATGDVWVPTTDVGSPVEPIGNDVVHVTFAKESAVAARFPSRVAASGLPAGTGWAATVGATTYGAAANGTAVDLPGGPGTAFNASTVVLANGISYVPSNVTVLPFVVNATATTASLPAVLNVSGPALYTVGYTPRYLLTVSASHGGSATPGSGWIPANTSVTLTATPDAGYHFVGWSGTGAGATTTAQDGALTVTITPGGPVTEFATFRVDPAPTWNVTFEENGLPYGTTFLVSVGATTYAGIGAFRVPGIVNGTYVVAAPTLYRNSTASTQYVPTDVATPYASAAGGALVVDANGTVTVSYATQYRVALVATPADGGTLAPAAGPVWVDADTPLLLTATPAPGYQFDGWNSSVSGLLTTTSPSTTVTVTAPMGITARFELRPIAPPDVFTLTVTETGLPAGVAWDVNLGSLGASGTAAALVVGGLNGSYALTVPTVSAGVGVRYVATVPASSWTASSNASLAITFAPQYLVTVEVGAGGSVTPNGTFWVDPGTTVALTATPNASFAFAGWAGASSDTTLATSFPVSGPATVVAAFVPVYAPAGSSHTSATDGLPLALGAVVALLAVGVVLGIVLGRLRNRPRAEAAPDAIDPSATDPGDEPPIE